MQVWLAKFAALFLEQAWPWLSSLVIGWINALLFWLANLKQRAADKLKREDASKKVSDDIKSGAGRAERQKDEENEFNS